MQHYAAWHCAALYCAALCSMALCSIILCSIILCSMVLCSIILCDHVCHAPSEGRVYESTWYYLERSFRSSIQQHRAASRVEGVRHNNLLLIQLRLVHAVVKKLLLAVPHMVYCAVTFIAAHCASAANRGVRARDVSPQAQRCEPPSSEIAAKA